MKNETQEDMKLQLKRKGVNMGMRCIFIRGMH